MKTSLDLSAFRHPYERPIWVGAVLVNAMICVLAVGIALRGGEIAYDIFPFLQGYGGRIRAIAVAAVLAPPGLVFARNRRLARVRGGSVRVTATQFPTIHRRFLSHCAKLGVSELPTLWISDEGIGDDAHSYAAWHREYVVLGTDYMEKDPAPLEDVWSFLLGRELGRLALGHVRWWDELLLAYVERIPWVRRPLRHVRVYSLDRVAALVEPEGVRALVIQASGRRPLPATNVAEHIRSALKVGGFWIWLTNITEEQPHSAVRMQKLYAERRFDLEHDLARFGGADAVETAVTRKG